jgi:hypothetical protein
VFSKISLVYSLCDEDMCSSPLVSDIDRYVITRKLLDYIFCPYADGKFRYTRLLFRKAGYTSYDVS